MPAFVGWIVVINATNVAMLIAFRILCGLTLGVVHTVVLPMYLGEIGSDAVRGSVSTIHGVMAKSGICFSFAIGPFVSFRLMGWLELIPITLFMLTFVWCPESPYWLLGQHRTEDALHSLRRLRGHDDVLDEFEQMKVNIQRAEEHPISYASLLEPNNRRGLVVTLGLSVGIVMCGTEAILAFAQVIYKAVGSPLRPQLLSLITGGVLMATTFVAAATVDRVGRRPLLLCSTVGLFVCNGIIATYFALIKAGVDISSSSWLPMLAVIVFVISYGMGLATVTFAVIGEILPKNLKAMAGVVFGMTVSLLSMVVMKMFQVLGDSVGYVLIYSTFTVFSALLFPFIWFYIPETKGKPLNEILEMLQRTK